jgi:site-specific DNA-methyltransferase (adenine-specific)
LKDEKGKIYQRNIKNGKEYRYYLHKGVLPNDWWSDVQALNPAAKERLGYPTQKPETLLERIIKASSNEGDVVLDPFCGCGTAIAVAQKLQRKWIGIDITHLAITLIKNRLKDSCNIEAKRDYAVVGEPVDLSGAHHLALEDRLQFQWWALGLVGARPVEKKKGADKGIDGRRNFIDGKRRDEKYMIFSVKSGHTGVKDMRDLGWVVEREKAAIGVLITLEEPTRDMRKEAAGGDFYHSDYQDTKHPRLQIITIEELLAGKKLDLPVLAQRSATDLTFKKAPKAKSKVVNNGSLDFDK